MAQNQRILYQIACDAGIRRDGTQLDTNFWTAGKWVRFYRKRPKKMGGIYRSSIGVNGVIRAIAPHYYSNKNYVTLLSSAGIERAEFNTGYDITNIQDRTPVSGFSASAAWLWQWDVIPDFSGGTAAQLCVHANRNGTADEETAYPVFQGTLNGSTTAFTSVGQSVSGGCCVLGPYLFIYGSNGLIQNSIAGNATVWTGGQANAANVCGSKIIRGMSMRGSGQSPSGVFWSRDSLIKVSFIGGNAAWRYDTITNQTSLISHNAVIEYDNVFFWMGMDRFFIYEGGGVKELPNQINQNWLFTNIDLTNAHKVWTMKNPRWGEIWWFFVSKNSPDGECDRAVIFNVREMCWYDAEVSRSAGVTSATLQYPILAGNTAGTGVGEKFPLYTHERGTDLVQGATTTPIESYIETPDFGYSSGSWQGSPQGANFATRVIRIEPDFIQSGEMTATVRGSNYPKGATVVSDDYPFGSGTTKVDLREQRRNITLRFTSDVVGGDYEMGKTILHLEKGDVRG